MTTAREIRKAFNATSESFYDASGINQALGELLWYSAFAMNREKQFSVSLIEGKGRASYDSQENKLIIDRNAPSSLGKKVFIQSKDLLDDIVLIFKDYSFEIEVIYTYTNDDYSFDPDFNKIKYTLPYEVKSIIIINDIFIQFLENIPKNP